MKKLSISLMTAAIVLLAGGCFSHDSVVGVPGKEIILPAKDGEKSLPAGVDLFGADVLIQKRHGQSLHRFTQKFIEALPRVIFANDKLSHTVPPFF